MLSEPLIINLPGHSKPRSPEAEIDANFNSKFLLTRRQDRIQTSQSKRLGRSYFSEFLYPILSAQRFKVVFYRNLGQR